MSGYRKSVTWPFDPSARRVTAACRGASPFASSAFPRSTCRSAPMSEPLLLLLLLGVITASLCFMTVTLFVTARVLRTTLRRVDVILPEAEQALREARYSLRQARRLLAKGDRAAQHVESVVHRACDAAAAALERIVQLKGSVEHFVMGRLGNGAGAEPRHHHRGK